jgi:hypothetical protein
VPPRVTGCTSETREGHSRSARCSKRSVSLCGGREISGVPTVFSAVKPDRWRAAVPGLAFACCDRITGGVSVLVRYRTGARARGGGACFVKKWPTHRSNPTKEVRRLAVVGQSPRIKGQHRRRLECDIRRYSAQWTGPRTGGQRETAGAPARVKKTHAKGRPAPCSRFASYPAAVHALGPEIRWARRQPLLASMSERPGRVLLIFGAAAL